MKISDGTYTITTKGSLEVAIDANTEGGYKLYVQSGTLYAYPSLESGSSLSQSCYTASLSTSNWYSFTQSGTAFAFKVPASGTWVVSGGAILPSFGGVGGGSLYSVSKSNGTTIFDGYGATGATVSSGSAVSLTSYSGGNSGGGGGQPGGGGGPGGRH